MSPRTRLIPLAGALALLSACGEPPRPLPTSPPYATSSSAPTSLAPSLPLGGQPLPTLTGLPTNPGLPANPGLPGYPVNTGYPTYTIPPTTRPTTAPTTKSATPTPAHAGRCTGQPTGAQILALIRGKDGVPNASLRIFEGPFCSGNWTLTTVEEVGRTEDQLEPLMVVSTGRGSTLTFITAGSDVCTKRVETEAPPGIRVLACGF
ncbi:MAG: hypothetical protein ABW022_10885 [Actinoplanes sp.]